MRLLWIPHTTWTIPQRAHHFCRQLATRHEVHVTDWVADFRSPADYVSRRYLRNFVYRRSQDNAIAVHGIPRISPALFFPALRRLNAALFARYLRTIVRRERIDVVVGTFVAPPPAAPRLIFDMFDDNVAYWLESGRPSSYATEIAATEAAYLRQADEVVAASSVSVDRLRERGYSGPVTLIPNGVRLDDFPLDGGRLLRESLGLSGRVVGLVGNHDKRGELDKVLEVARLLRALPVTFLIVGRGAAIGPAQVTVLREGLTNVRFAGFVPPARIGPFFAAIDVGLCPYKKTRGADAGSPMRLLAHSAAGSAVVCTELEEVKRMGFPNVFLVGQSPQEMAEGVRQALSRPRERPAVIEHYDIEALARRYERVLEGAADRADRIVDEPIMAGLEAGRNGR